MAAVMSYPGHVFCTVRMKEKHAQERDERKGKDVVRSLGLLPIQRAGIEYEFDVALFVHGAGSAGEVAKTRSSRLRELRTFTAPGARLAEELLAWSRGPGAAAERAAGEAEAE